MRLRTKTKPRTLLPAAVIGMGLCSGCFLESKLPEGFGQCDDVALGDPPSETPTYHRDVRPLLERECATCHREGGIGPFSLEGYDNAEMWAAFALAAVDRGQMPPWPPSHCCAELRHPRALDPDEVEVLRSWIDEGMPQGDPDDAPPPPEPGGLSRVDLEVAMEEPYTPSASLGPSDDSRCFLIDWPEDQRTHVTGLDMVPGADDLVHHAIVYALPNSEAAFYEGLDALDETPGWSCPGGAPQSAEAYVGGWVPGAPVHDFPPGLGKAVDPGSKLLLNVHYELSAGVAPDQTAIRFKLDQSVDTEVEGLAVVNPAWLSGATMLIPAGDSDVMHAYAYDPSAWFNLGQPLKVHDVSLHMHELGTSASLAVLRANGDVDCLLHIDDWDFAWQGEYFLEDPVELQFGDRLYVECHFDNSADNQPNGESPADQWWGDDKEMCLGSVLVSR